MIFNPFLRQFFHPKPMTLPSPLLPETGRLWRRHGFVLIVVLLILLIIVDASFLD
jgi:uncharacterized protein (TIGR01732 family)